MQRQPIESQRGEVEFRKKLYLQQVEGKRVLDDEFDATGIEKILQDRMKKTLDQMTALRQSGVALSPYVEIGAERCQRSLVMENDLGANGAAADISYDLLRSGNHYGELFSRPKCPLRICCDANNLPFESSSIPFVFCYQTLHHFPDPAPILKEIHRVLLPAGSFFFDEEPYKKILHVNLYSGGRAYSEESLRRSTLRRALDRFFCRERSNEVEHGIIENDRISVRSWKRALAHFDEKDIELKPTNRFPVLKSKLFHPSSYLRHFAACLLGGDICGLARKRGSDASRNSYSIYDALICPSCRETAGVEVRLRQSARVLLCPKCSKAYPVVEEVLFLFAYDKFRELYPEVLDSIQRS